MVRAKLLEQHEYDISLNPKTKTFHIKKLEVQDPEFFDIILDQPENNRGRFILKILEKTQEHMSLSALEEKSPHSKFPLR